MIRPNYAVRALIPYPKIEYEKPPYFEFFRKTDALITDCYKNRRKIYGFLFLTFCIFSVLGLYYYSAAASGLAPIPIYTPVKTGGVFDFGAVFGFRKLHLFASLFLFLTGFTIFGKPAALLFTACDAFLVGFSLQYSIKYLQEKSSLVSIILYFLCISLFMMIDLLISCEVFKYSGYARGGTKEMFLPKRIAGYLITYILITGMNLTVSYIFLTICK